MLVMVEPTLSYDRKETQPWTGLVTLDRPAIWRWSDSGHLLSIAQLRSHSGPGGRHIPLLPDPEVDIAGDEVIDQENVVALMEDTFQYLLLPRWRQESWR